MELYSGTLLEFIDATKTNQIARVLEDAYTRWYGHRPREEEVYSWNNSLVKFKDVLEDSVPNDTGVFLEFQIPSTPLRLDAMICGRSRTGHGSAEIVELKQWSRCEPTEEESLVLRRLRNGKVKTFLHPAAQVARYEQYLRDGNTAFYGERPLRLSSCAYLHNYRPSQGDPILDTKFEKVIEAHPVFFADDYAFITDRIRKHVGAGGGLEILRRIRGSKVAPNKKLLRHVGEVLKGKPTFTLLDDQVVAFESISTVTKRALRDGAKCCVIIRGGPGTGKSLVAINLLANLSLANVNARFATGSKAFTETLRKTVGQRAASRFDYTLNYANVGENEVDLLVVDEAHRIRLTSVSRFTPKANRSGLSQVEELLRAGRVSAFFIDDLQAVRPGEVGTTQYIEENARRLGIPVKRFDLQIQFRCQGSDAFVSWVDAILGFDRLAPTVYHKTDAFDFRLMDTPGEVESALAGKVGEGFSARLTAGFCWDWSDPRSDGTLVDDVTIDSFSRPWNAKHETGRLAKGIPRASLWANDPGGLGQIGCVYSAQGFEFDYAGVILGPDLTVEASSGRLVGIKKGSTDPAIRRAGEDAPTLIRRAYRVLLSRGLRGCYVTSTSREVLDWLRNQTTSV